MCRVLVCDLKLEDVPCMRAGHYSSRGCCSSWRTKRNGTLSTLLYTASIHGFGMSISTSRCSNAAVHISHVKSVHTCFFGREPDKVTRFSICPRGGQRPTADRQRKVARGARSSREVSCACKGKTKAPSQLPLFRLLWQDLSFHQSRHMSPPAHQYSIAYN